MRRVNNLWPLLALLLVLAGCAGLSKYREGIKVSVSDIEVLETTMMEQLYLVTLRIQNRNDQALTLIGGSFDLEINGREFGSGVSDARVTIPPFTDEKIQVRMVSTLFGMLRLVQSFRESTEKALEYEISGRLSIEDALGGVPFSESGRISLPEGRSTQGKNNL